MLDSSDSQLDFAFGRQDLVNFKRIDRATEIHSVGDLNYYVNDYWTSAQRQSNSLHEISYRACFRRDFSQITYIPLAVKLLIRKD